MPDVLDFQEDKVDFQADPEAAAPPPITLSPLEKLQAQGPLEQGMYGEGPMARRTTGAGAEGLASYASPTFGGSIAAPFKFASDIASIPFVAGGQALAAGLRAARRVPSFGLGPIAPPAQPTRPTMISPTEIRPMTEEEQEERDPIQAGRPLIPPRQTQLEPQGSDAARMVAGLSSPESISMLAGGMGSRLLGYVILGQMAPQVLDAVKTVAGSSATPEDKRDRINNLVLPVIIGLRQTAAGRPAGAPDFTQELQPLAFTGAAIPGRPRGFNPRGLQGPPLPPEPVRPTVPETPAQPQESAVAEIRRKNLRTRQQVIDNFPGFIEGGRSGERAAELLRQAWGERQGPPLPPQEPPAAPPGAPARTPTGAPPAGPSGAVQSQIEQGEAILRPIEQPTAEEAIQSSVQPSALPAKGTATPPLPESARQRLQARVRRAKEEGVLGPPEKITAAAYRTPEGIVETGANHPEILQRLGVKGFESAESRNTPQFGFVTDKGRFVTRDEAGPVAQASGQDLKAFEPGEPVHSNEVESPTEPGVPLGESTAPSKPERIEDTPLAGKTLGEWEAVRGPADLPKGIARAELARWLAVPNQPNRILQALGNKRRTREIHSPPATEVAPVQIAPAAAPEAPAPPAPAEPPTTSVEAPKAAPQVEQAASEPQLPKLVSDVLARSDHDANWVWMHATREEKAAVDKWIVDTKHPSATQPGTSEGRFKSLVEEQLKEAAPQKAGDKVESEVAKTASIEGQRPAKAVKSELVSRLEEAVDKAPSESAILEKYAVGEAKWKPPQLMRPTVKGSVPLAEWLLKNEAKSPDAARRLKQEAFDKSKHAKVTIDIPGDGTFTILNTKEALGEVLARAKALSTSPGAPTKVTRRTVTKEQAAEYAKEAEQQAKGKPSLGPGAAAAAEFDEPSPPDPAVLGLKPDTKLDRFVNEQVREWQNMVAGFRQLGGRGGQKQDIARAVNAADNIPRIWGQQAGNSVRLQLRDVREQNAVTALMQTFKMSGQGLSQEDAARMGELEFQGDPLGYLQAKQTDLETFAQQMRNEGKNLEAGAAVDLANAMAYARAHYAELKPVTMEVKKRLDMQLKREEAAGLETDYERWYVPQRHDLDLLPAANRPIVLGGGRGGGPSSQFRKAKYYEDYASAIEAGFVPRTLSIADLLEHRVMQGERLVARKAMFEKLKTIKDPVDGNPIVTKIPTRTVNRGVDPETGEPISSKTVEAVPIGYEPFTVIPGVRLAVHSGYARMLRALTGTSQIAESAVISGLTSLAAFEKHLGLALDTFHASRVAQTEFALTGKVSLGDRLRRGTALLEYTAADLSRAVANGELTQEQADWITKPQEWEVNGRTARLSPKAVVSLGLKNGLNVGRIADAIYRDWIREMPFIGTINKFVFDKLSRSAMTHGFMAEFGRVARNHPEWDANKVASTVASDINVLFGNLQKESWVQSPSLKSIMQIVFLAPQWVESLMRREGRAALQLGQAGLRLAQGKPAQLGTAGKAMGSGLAMYVAATQILNLITRHQLTFQNPEEGHKLDAWVPDPFGKGTGFFISPLSVFGEITHEVLRHARTAPDLAAALSEIGANKLGNLGRAIGIAALGRDPLTGQKLIGSAQRAMAVGTQLIPVPIIASGAARVVAAAAIPGLSQPTGADLERQLASSFGFKTEVAPSAQNQVRTLVERWKSTQEPALQSEVARRLKEEFHSSYSELRGALSRGDMNQAGRAYQALRQEGTTPKTIRATIEHPHPFAGSKRLESRFYDSLSPEQQKLYDQALQEREEIASKFEQMLDNQPQLTEEE